MTLAQDNREGLRWSTSLVVVLAVHVVAVAATLSARSAESEAITAPMEAVMIELAPEPVTPPAPPQEIPPGPQQEQQPQPKPEPRPVPEVEPDVVDPYQAPVTEDTTTQQVDRSTAPPPSRLPPAATAAAPQSVRSSGDSLAPASWESRLLAHLETHQRYPQRARSNRQQGVAYLRISVGRNGELLAHALERSSGHAVLDQEAIAALLRAVPLPAPPSEIVKVPVERIVPMQFIYRR